jgi:hypothetical protein
VTTVNQHDTLPAGTNGKPHRPASDGRHTSSVLKAGFTFPTETENANVTLGAGRTRLEAKERDGWRDSANYLARFNQRRRPAKPQWREHPRGTDIHTPLDWMQECMEEIRARELA